MTMAAVASLDAQTDAGVHVSFVVPAYNAASTLPACIAALRASAPAGSEIVVADDCSTDDTAAIAERLADVVVRRPRQGGAAHCRNDAARAANGRILVFTDADVTVTPAAVAGVLGHLQHGADVVFGAYGALPGHSARGLASVYKNLLHHYTHLSCAGYATTFWSGFGAMRKDVFWAVGGFDTASTRSADVEDIHLGYRLSGAGYRIVLDPALQVTHHKDYTVRRIVISDVVHRAIPWTRAMIQLRTFHADLNLRPSALFSGVLAGATVADLVATPFLGVRNLLSVGLLLVAWLWSARGFIGYVRRHSDARTTVGAAALFFLYFLYSPIGLLVGLLGYPFKGRWKPTIDLTGIAVDLGAVPEVSKVGQAMHLPSVQEV